MFGLNFKGGPGGMSNGQVKENAMNMHMPFGGLPGGPGGGGGGGDDGFDLGKILPKIDPLFGKMWAKKLGGNDSGDNENSSQERMPNIGNSYAYPQGYGPQSMQPMQGGGYPTFGQQQYYQGMPQQQPMMQQPMTQNPWGRLGGY